MYNIVKSEHVLLLAFVLEGLKVQGVILHFARKMLYLPIHMQTATVISELTVCPSTAAHTIIVQAAWASSARACRFAYQGPVRQWK